MDDVVGCGRSPVYSSTRMVLPCLYHIENTVNGPTQSCVYIIRRSVCTVRYIPVYVPHQVPIPVETVVHHPLDAKTV
jgi:hypothetical protein